MSFSILRTLPKGFGGSEGPQSTFGTSGTMESPTLILYFLHLMYFCNFLNLENKILCFLTKNEISMVCLYALRLFAMGGNELRQSLLEYKPMNAKLGDCAAWSDLIHVILWRNNGFLHSFCNFSKNNAFGENFIRTKFILHKIFFRMSIRSSKKTSRMFFNLCWKTAKTYLWGHMTILRGRGCLVTKINTNFFVRNEVLSIF